MRLSTLSLLVPLLAQVSAQYGQPENGGGEGGNTVHAPQGSTAAAGKPTAKIVEGYQPPFERGAAPQQETVIVGSDGKPTPHAAQRNGDATPKSPSPTPTPAEEQHGGVQRPGDATPGVVTYHGVQRPGDATPQSPSPTPTPSEEQHGGVQRPGDATPGVVTYHGVQRPGDATPQSPAPTPAENEEGTSEELNKNDKGVLIATGEDDGKDQGGDKCKRNVKRGPRRADTEAEA